MLIAQLCPTVASRISSNESFEIFYEYVQIFECDLNSE